MLIFLKACITEQPPCTISGDTPKNCVGTGFCVHSRIHVGVFKQAANSATHYQDIGPTDTALSRCFSKCSVSNYFLPCCSYAPANGASDTDPVNTASR